MVWWSIEGHREHHIGEETAGRVHKRRRHNSSHGYFNIGILLRILWPLIVYEVPVSTVEEMERSISWHVRRWLWVQRTFASIGLYSLFLYLYSTSAKLSLPLRSLTEEFKVIIVRSDIILRTRQDDKVAVRSGRKWKTREAVKYAERLAQGYRGTVIYGTPSLSYNAVYALYGMVISIYDVVTSIYCVVISIHGAVVSLYGVILSIHGVCLSIYGAVTWIFCVIISIYCVIKTIYGVMISIHVVVKLIYDVINFIYSVVKSIYDIVISIYSAIKPIYNAETPIYYVTKLIYYVVKSIFSVIKSIYDVLTTI